jgi:hypothetical protein
VARRRTNAQDRWRRLRSARALVEKGRPYADSVEALRQRYGVSVRQAKRYLADARAAPGGPPPPAKVALSVSINEKVLRDVRRAARCHRRSVSAEVEAALRSYLSTSAAR